MTYRVANRDQHLSADGGPKRILALDGGGLRGILSLAILQQVETVLRERHDGDADFRLAHYFDLIAGTSTGAIIAAALAMGRSVEWIRGQYMQLGKRVFEKSWLRQGFLRAKYDEGQLVKELQEVFGADTTLGGPKLQTGLLVITKRIDTGSCWPISNNPRGKYFADRPSGIVGNGEYPLWQVVRASTAAPAYFDSEPITIAEATGLKPARGDFIDGGMSPFNNPALMAVMYATLDGYRIGWPTGADRLLLVSVGTGAADPAVKRSNLAAAGAVKSLVALMGDCASLQEIMLQWMSSSRTARVIDREIGDLQHDLVAGAPLLNYLRYNVDLRPEEVRKLDRDLVDDERIASLSAMDAPDNMEILHSLGERAGARDVRADDFPIAFDLRAA
ncbi:MAG TPA: patatin-like phospholipase family protein [Steroidobacteraceae bacterium]|nr:patatin-like phospholipase family protein [Steroidobacteraceae bacterium]